MEVKLSAPWETYTRKLRALFSTDDEIEVLDVDSDYRLVIIAKNHRKFDALCQLLPPTKTFGNVTISICIEDQDENENANYSQLIEDLFKDNTHFKEVKKVIDATGTEHDFVMFYPEVLQFFNDNMFDYNGFWSGLAQDIARDVFDEAASNGVHFCTADVREN